MFKPLSYLAGVTAAKLQQHLPNMNVIRKTQVSSMIFKNKANSIIEGSQLVTPTLGALVTFLVPKQLRF